MSAIRTALRSLIPALLVVAACEDTTAPRATTIEAQAGANQSGEVGAPLAQPVTVRLLDAKGFPVRGATITWAVGANSGALVTSEVTTDRLGTARAQWTLGNTAGPQTLTAQADGLAPLTITATATPGPAALLTLSRDSLVTRNVGDTVRIVPTVTDRFGNALVDQAVTYTSSNTSIATVSNTGLVTVRGRGNTTIQVQRGTVTTQFRVNVTTIARIVVTPNPLLFSSLNQTQQLTVRAEDAAGVPFTNVTATWNAINPAVVQVSATGVVRAVGNGGTTIQANVDGAIGSTAAIVQQVATGVAISPANPAVGIGSVIQLTANSVDAGGSPIPGQNFTWTSANPAIATVSSTGLVTGVARGAADIRASIGNTTAATSVAVTTTVTFVSAGDSHTCGLGVFSTTEPSAGTCWGFNAVGQLGNGTTDVSSTMSDVSGVLQFSQLSAGSFHNCGLISGGQLWCWGSNLQGQLSGPVGTSLIPRQVAGANSYAFVSAGYQHTCAVLVSGNIQCWGSNSGGQLGIGAASETCNGISCETLPRAVGGSELYTRVASGERHTCALGVSGAAYCWGTNTLGQLGTGNATASPVPISVTGGLTYIRLAAGNDFSCALVADGRAYCWGRNAAGQLGIGNTSDTSTPTQVAGGLTFTQIATGGSHACGITANGEAWCWGANVAGQLGNGTGLQSTVPLLVPAPGITFTNIATGRDHTCATTSAGAAYCWGRNTGGQLGNGTFDLSLVPTRVR